jgi:hypothetical protein
VENYICAYGEGTDKGLRELDNEELIDVCLLLGSSDGGRLNKLGL